MKANIIEINGKKWVVEIHNDSSLNGFQITDHLYSEKSSFQTVDVFQTKEHGKLLVNDGIMMVSERDEFIYHEMISHVALFSHPCPKKVLIIGGGDGGTAREVLKHSSVEKCVMVEIDSCVVDSCKKHIPQTSSELENSRLELRIEDGIKFVKETKERFDIVLIDSTDPIGPAAPLFNLDFYQNVSKILNDKGIVISQCESPYYEGEVQKDLLKVLSKCFKKVNLYNYSNLTYPGGLWSFSFASNSLCPLKDFKSDRVKESKINFLYYNEGIHKSAFSLPSFLKEKLKDVLGVLEK